MWKLTEEIIIPSCFLQNMTGQLNAYAELNRKIARDLAKLAYAQQRKVFIEGEG